MGATVGGGKYSVDGIMLKIREDSKKSRNGGFIKACTKDDPGIMCLAGDGAQLSKKYSGVRVSLFAGSTDYLNQSSLEIYNLAIYKVQGQGAGGVVRDPHKQPCRRAARAQAHLPRRRLAAQRRWLGLGCLRALPAPCPATSILRDAADADAHVRAPARPQMHICLVGDKPFLRHFCGLQSHNSKGFGAPFCNCTDENLYNFTLDPATHYTGTKKYESLCGSCHVAPWEVEGAPEPKKWTMTCECCNTVSACGCYLWKRVYAGSCQQRVCATGSALAAPSSGRGFFFFFFFYFCRGGCVFFFPPLKKNKKKQIKQKDKLKQKKKQKQKTNTSKKTQK